jgi:predicted RNA-binding protein with RPS1 domain
MAQMTTPELSTDNVQYSCTIKHVAYFGLFVEIPELSEKGLLRITEMSDPSILQKSPTELIGTKVVARIIGREKADGPFILSQH